MAASLKAARVSFASRSLGGAGGRTRRPPCVYTLERTAYSVQTSRRTEKEEAEEAGGEDRADVRAENQPGYVATYTFCRRKVSTGLEFVRLLLLLLFFVASFLPFYCFSLVVVPPRSSVLLLLRSSFCDGGVKVSLVG